MPSPEAMDTLRADRPGEHILRLTFDRPPVNALDAAAYAAGARALKDAGTDPTLRVVILTAAGEKAFCAGTDIGSFDTEPEVLESAALDFFTTLAHQPLPVVGALNGPAVGGGLMVAAHCDVLVAVPGAFFEVPELRIGLPASISHVRQIVPWFPGLRMLLLGERLTAEDALRQGVLAEIAEPDALAGRTLDIAGRIAALEPRSTRLARAFYRDGVAEKTIAGYRRELAAIREIRRIPRPRKP